MNIQISTNPITGITYAEDLSITGRAAVAICHPNDKFDEGVGIHLAIHRLLEGCNIDDTVIVHNSPIYPVFIHPENARYIINYLVIRLGVFPGVYLDLIDDDPHAVRNGRPVQYEYDYDEGEYAILRNKLTGKIAVCKKERLIRA